MQLLNDVNIYALLPETYQNVYTECISYALNQAIKLIIHYNQYLGIMHDIEKLPESILDELAIEYNIRIYKQNADIESKRELIKNALIICMGAGTKKNFEYTLSTIYGPLIVTEWYEYNGTPYHFKVKFLNESIGKNDESICEIESNIEETKNVRSILDSLELNKTKKVNSFCSSVSITSIYSSAVALKVKQSNAVIDGGSLNTSSSNVIDGGDLKHSSDRLIDGGTFSYISGDVVNGGSLSASPAKAIDGGNLQQISNKIIDGNK